MTLRYAVVGTGALGGYYGGLLAHAGFDVHFLCRSDHARIRDHGLRLQTEAGLDVTLDVRACRDAGDLPEVDVALVCLKTTQNDALPDLLPPIVGPHTMALVLQNGLGVEEQTAAVVGPGRVLGGLCFVCANKVGPGHVRHLGYGRIALGAFATPGITPRMEAIAADFEAAGVPMSLEPDLLLARWQKLVWNVPYNGLCTLHGLTTDRVMADPALREEVDALMGEVVAAAHAADGKEIGPDFVQQMVTNTTSMGPYKPSMLIDREQGRPLELRAILGEPLCRARAAGCTIPHLRRLHDALADLA